MRILIAHGSKRGGTAEIAERIGETLRSEGFDVDVRAAHAVRGAPEVRGYDAVLVGGALYAGCWHRDARRFVLRHVPELRGRRVWFFSSGPLGVRAGSHERTEHAGSALDDSANGDIPPTPAVAQLIAHVGADGHATFGGRLARDAHGFVASAMAKRVAGDFRDWTRIDAWARRVGEKLRFEPARAKRPETAFAPLPPVGLIVALTLAAGLPAMAGGASLVARPDGSLIGLPLSVLAHAPFDDFLVPGLLLFALVGVANAWSALLHLSRSDLAPLASAVSGMALTIWMLVEVAMLRSFHPLQAAYLAMGVAIVVVSLRTVRNAFPTPAPGHEPAPHH